MENIRRRFYHIHLYFKDLMQLVQSMMDNNNGEKLRSKAKRIWILFRLVQEESIRSYLEMHA